MVDELRRTRVGLVQAAGLLKVTPAWLRHALANDEPLNGRPIPKPMMYAGHRRNQPYWELGTLQDFIEEK